MSQRTQKLGNLLRPKPKDPYVQAYDWVAARPALIVLIFVIIMWVAIIIWSLQLMTLASIGGV